MGASIADTRLPREDQLGAGHRRPAAADQDDPAELRHPDQPLRAGRLRGVPVAGRRRRRHPDLLPVAGPRRPHRPRRHQGRAASPSTASRAWPTPVRATSRPSRTAHWESDPTSDIGRIARQQQFIKLALKRAIAKGARNPFVDSELIGTAQKDVTLDNQLTTGDLLNLADAVPQLRPQQPPGVHAADDRARSSAAPTSCCSTRWPPSPSSTVPRPERLEQPEPGGRGVGDQRLGRSAQAQMALARWPSSGSSPTARATPPSFRNSHTTVRYAPGRARRPPCRWPATCPSTRASSWTTRCSGPQRGPGHRARLHRPRRPPRGRPRTSPAFLATTTTTTPRAARRRRHHHQRGQHGAQHPAGSALRLTASTPRETSEDSAWLRSPSSGRATSV